MGLDDIRSELDNLRLMRASLVGRRDLITEAIQSLNKELESINSNIETFEKTRLFLQKVSETARNVAKVQIESVVTRALQYVFGDHYSFKIDIRSTASRPEADFLVVTKHGSKTVESIPTTGKGGGIVDLLAVALKFALLELVDYDGCIWMDEPFKHISEDYIPAAGKLLTFMGETSGRQINIITHNPRLADMCNKVNHVGQKNGISFIGPI